LNYFATTFVCMKFCVHIFLLLCWLVPLKLEHFTLNSYDTYIMWFVTCSLTCTWICWNLKWIQYKTYIITMEKSYKLWIKCFVILSETFPLSCSLRVQVLTGFKMWCLCSQRFIIMLNTGIATMWYWHQWFIVMMPPTEQSFIVVITCVTKTKYSFTYSMSVLKLCPHNGITENSSTVWQWHTFVHVLDNTPCTHKVIRDVTS
jgi:hypothetical protein